MLKPIQTSTKFLYHNSIYAVNFLNENIIYRVRQIFSFVVNKISSAFSQSPRIFIENYSMRGNGFSISRIIEYQNLINQRRTRELINEMRYRDLMNREFKPW